MTVAHTTVLELLGKQVSFIHSIKVGSDVYSSDYSGTVTNVVISLNNEPEISIDDGDFHKLSKLSNFQIN